MAYMNHILLFQALVALESAAFGQNPPGPKVKVPPAEVTAASQPSSGVQVITLMEAVQKAQETFSKARISRADRNAQKEKVSGSWSEIGPRVKLDYSHAEYEDELAQITGNGKLIARPKTIDAGALTIYQPVTGLGALVKKALYEESQLEMKQDSFLLAKSEGAYLAAELWLGTYRLNKLQQIDEDSVKAVEQQLKDAYSLERVGRLNRGDVLKLELAVSEAKLRQTKSSADLSFATANFREIMGLDPEAKVQLGGELPLISPKTYQLQDAVKVASVQRLDTKIGRDQIEMAEFGKSLVYSQFAPQVNLFVKAEKNFGQLYGAFPSRIVRSYGVNMTWDIWSNGSNVFALREAADQIVKFEEAARAGERRATVEVQNALNAYNSNKVALNQAQIAVKQAEEAYRIESVRFKTGSRSATDVILAEASQSQAKGRLIGAQVELINSHFKFQKAMGQNLPTL